MQNDVWTDWENHYRISGIDPGSICKDGPIDEVSYRNAHPKILFVLREVNNYRGGNLKDYLADGPKYPIWFAVARWAAGLLNDFPPFQEIIKPRILKDSIRKTAIINLKKASGGPQADPQEVNLYAYRDRQLLRQQVDLIAPEIVVACGTFDTIVWLLELDINPLDLKNKVYTVGPKNWIVINWRHPTRANMRETYQELSNLWRILRSKG